jgi:hypothetical protein
MPFVVGPWIEGRERLGERACVLLVGVYIDVSVSNLRQSMCLSDETNCWFVRGLRNLVFVGLKFFFLVLGSLASSSSSAANMSAMFVVDVQLKDVSERARGRDRHLSTRGYGDGAGDS